METKTHWKKNFDRNFIGAPDFQPNEEKHVTISGFDENVKVGQQTGKTCIYFEDGVKPMVLNVTNGKTIQKVVGSRFMEDWIGKRITLFVKEGVEAFREKVDAVRVRPVAPRATLPTISDDRFQKMLAKIADGSYDKDKAMKQFTFTPDQLEQLETI